MTKTMMILVAGPYRSGTDDDPQKMRNNLAVLESAALEVWRKGHLPVMGEWLALPLMEQAGSKDVGDEVYQALAYPVAERLLTRCDAVLRLPGSSKGADQDVAFARKNGLTIYTSASEIPGMPR